MVLTWRKKSIKYALHISTIHSSSNGLDFKMGLLAIKKEKMKLTIQGEEILILLKIFTILSFLLSLSILPSSLISIFVTYKPAVSHGVIAQP